MVLVIYILFSILLIMALFSVSNDEYRGGAIVLLSAQVVSILATYKLLELAADGSVVGAFFAAGLNMIISFVLIIFHDTAKKFILKLATASVLFTCVHMLYIMTYIEPLRAASWYYAPTFDLFYWNYGELQIVLTLYMISLFWESGIMGLKNGFNKTIFRPDKSGQYINPMGYIHDLLNPYCWPSSRLLVGKSKTKNNIYKKGIQ